MVKIGMKNQLILKIVLIALVITVAGLGYYSINKPAIEKTLTETVTVTVKENTTSTIILPTEKENTTITSFDSKDKLVEFLKKSVSSQNYFYGAPIFLEYDVRAVPLTTTATVAEQAAGAPKYYTGTNVQVEGIDEADFVKTDGTYIYVSRENTVYILRGYPFEDSRLVTKIVLEDQKHFFIWGLFVSGDKLVVIAAQPQVYILEKSATEITETGVPKKPSYPPRELTAIYIYDISDREKPSLISKHNITGHPIASRLINNTVIIVTQEPIYFTETPILPLLDGIELETSQIYYVPSKPANSYATLAKINLENNNTTGISLLIPPINRVYVSWQNIYLFTSEWSWDIIKPEEIVNITLKYIDPDYVALVTNILSNNKLSEQLKNQLVYQIINEAVQKIPESQKEILKNELMEKAREKIGKFIGEKTGIIKVSLTNLSTSNYITVEGRLLDQFAIHEKEGHLILALTAEKITNITIPYSPIEIRGLPPIIPETVTTNRIVIFDEQLNITGKLEDLAPGERVYSARYVGDTLYLVTFRRVDPLFAIDLSNLEEPRVLGYIKMPGFSEYLHPISSEQLLGIGYETNDMGRIIGLKITLFNVSNPTNISIIDEIVIKKQEWGYSEAFYDHKAFTYNPVDKIAALPVNFGYQKTGLVILVKIDDNGMQEYMEIEHGNVRRTIFLEKIVATISNDMVKLTSPEGEERSFVLK